MSKKIHLVGEVTKINVELLLKELENIETISKIEYIESTHDLKFDTDLHDYIVTIDRILEELGLNIKVIERKKSSDKTVREFEKKVFLFSNLRSTENAVFLVSYLMNDPQVREAKFDHNQKILTLETNDPFIYTKIKHVIDAFGENIEVTENYVKEQGISYELMYRYLYIALVLFSSALYIVTLQEPTFVTTVSGLVMYGLVALRLGLDAIENIRKKDYINFNNLVLLGTALLTIAGRPLEATIAVFAVIWLIVSGRSFQRQIVDRLVYIVDNLVHIVNVQSEDGVEQKQVEEVEKGDVIISKAGDILYFDGRVIEGEGTLDELLMNGHVDPIKAEYGSMITSGSEVIEGTIHIEVTNTYSQTFFNKVCEWNPKHLIEKGYLEIRDNKDNLFYIMSMLIISLIMVVTSFIVKQPHLLVSGLLVVIICYPASCSSLAPYMYENAMIESLKQRVLIKDENSLSKMIEWVRKKKIEEITEEQVLIQTEIQCHKGHYLDETIRLENDCIYRDMPHLISVMKYLKSFDLLWTRTRYLSYTLKIIAVLLFYVHILSFVGVIIVCTLLAFVTLLTAKGIMDKEAA